MRRRRGGSLPELLLVAWLFGLVLLGLGRFAAAQGQLAAAASDRARLEELIRSTRLVLGRELRYLAPGDVRALGPDSLRIRGVRGSGPVCGRGIRHVDVRFRGVRWPDPAKDSVLLIDERDPAGAGYAVTAASPSTRCAGGLRLDLDRDLDSTFAGGVAVVFESGTYHLSGGALRYRLGRGGRQPLTEAVLASGRISPSAGAAWGPLRIALALHADSLPTVTLRDPAFGVAPAPGPDPAGAIP